jgi:hypothetical protein
MTPLERLRPAALYEYFVSLANREPLVREIREAVLGHRLFDDEDARRLIASPAPQWFPLSAIKFKGVSRLTT